MEAGDRQPRRCAGGAVAQLDDGAGLPPPRRELRRVEARLHAADGVGRRRSDDLPPVREPGRGQPDARALEVAGAVELHGGGPGGGGGDGGAHERRGSRGAHPERDPLAHLGGDRSAPEGRGRATSSRRSVESADIGGRMPTFIMLSTLTPEGVQTVRNNPTRIREVNKELEQLGATVKAQWATLGHYDFVNVVEAPDEKTMARVSLELGSRGTGKWETMVAIPIDDFIATL